MFFKIISFQDSGLWLQLSIITWDQSHNLKKTNIQKKQEKKHKNTCWCIVFIPYWHASVPWSFDFQLPSEFANLIMQLTADLLAKLTCLCVLECYFFIHHSFCRTQLQATTTQGLHKCLLNEWCMNRVRNLPESPELKNQSQPLYPHCCAVSLFTAHQ